MKRSLLLTMLIAGPAALGIPTDAFAQSGVGDLDDPDDPGASSKDRSRRGIPDGEVREVTKGWYAKSNVGAAGYLLDFRGFANVGTSVGLSVGKDVVDRETQSAAVEFAFVQGIHNGCHYERQADLTCPGNAGGARPSPYIQGDLRTYTFQLAGEYSFYPTRRFGVGIRGLVGILGSPLLMDEEQYQRDVVTEWGFDPGYHGTGPFGLDKAHPVVGGGPTFEYYSRLAHFSVGADIDVFYGIGFDLGVNGTGYLKYTF